ncbi:MAG: ArsA family ATPase [Crenarchaeota archaeon]|nr:ArsA family ATPase [Thermoproteota archaeon]
MRVVITVGKGGVGKTTTAAGLGVALHERGYTILIVSLDPAHNLADVFNMRSTYRKTRVADRLEILEINVDEAVKKYLDEVALMMKTTFKHLSVLNIDKYIDVLSNAPGVEEHAIMNEFKRVLEENEDKDFIIFDMPPTGLSLRIVSLPFIHREWLRQLKNLRKAILDRRRMLRNVGEDIGGAPCEETEDPVMRELETMLRECEFLTHRLTSNDTRCVLVLAPETLPLLEAKRAFEKLRTLGISVSGCVVNKVLRLHSPVPELRSKLLEQEQCLNEIKRCFKDLVIVEVPFLEREPRGLDSLKTYANYIEPLVDSIVRS